MSYNNKSDLLIENILLENDLLNEVNLRSIKELINKIPKFTENTLKKIKEKVASSKFKKILKFLILNRKTIVSITMIGISTLAIGCGSNPNKTNLLGVHSLKNGVVTVNLSDKDALKISEERNHSKITEKFKVFLENSIINNVRYVTSNDYLHRLNIDKKTVFQKIKEFNSAVASGKDFIRYKPNNNTAIYFYYSPKHKDGSLSTFRSKVIRDTYNFVLDKTGDSDQAKQAKRSMHFCMSDTKSDVFGFACHTSGEYQYERNGHDHDHDHRHANISDDEYAVAVININDERLGKDEYLDFLYDVFVHELGHVRDNISLDEITIQANIFKNIKKRNNRKNISFNELFKLASCKNKSDKKKLYNLLTKLIALGQIKVKKQGKKYLFDLTVNKGGYVVKVEELKEFLRNVSSIIKDAGKYSKRDIKSFFYKGFTIKNKYKNKSLRLKKMKEMGIPESISSHPAFKNLLVSLSKVDKKYINYVIERYARGIMNENKLKSNELDIIAERVFIKLLSENTNNKKSLSGSHPDESYVYGWPAFDEAWLDAKGLTTWDEDRQVTKNYFKKMGLL